MGAHQLKTREHPGRKSRALSLVLLLLAISIMAYPVVATLWNDYRTQHIARQYDDLVEQIDPPSAVAEMLDNAHAYNERIAAEGHLPRPEDREDPHYRDYLSQISPFGASGVMATVTIPIINVDLPVYHGTTDGVLYRGAGHMYGSDLPVGGEGRTSVITAHTGMVNASMFDNLHKLEEGDFVYVTTLNQKMRYRVTGEETVKPEDWDAITYEDGVDKLVLLTCTPYGINSDRLLVTAVRDDGDGSATTTDAEQTSWLQLSWWMKLDLVLIVFIIAIALWASVRSYRRKAVSELEDDPNLNTGV